MGEGRSEVWVVDLQFSKFSPHGCKMVALAPAITFVLRQEEGRSHEELLYPATSEYLFGQTVTHGHPQLQKRLGSIFLPLDILSPLTEPGPVEKKGCLSIG